jgi:glycosyltransferase involved in cell wall biosynthesis
VFVSWRDLANPQAGGSEQVIDRLATGLLERGHEVALLSGGPVAGRAYPVYDTGGRWSQYVIAPRVARHRFANWDMLVDVSNGIPYFSPLWRSGALVMFVHHVHAEQWAQHFPRPVSDAGWFVERVVVPRLYRGQLVVTESTSSADALERIGVARDAIRVVPLGVDMPARSYLRSRSPLFLAVGRLVPHKRVDLLLQAWRRVEPVTGGHLVIVGDGPELARLRSQAPPSVEFTGWISEAEKRRRFEEAWLLVHTAQHEGWGLVVMEAAAAATPALAFAVPGVRDSVVPDRTGVLVDDAVGSGLEALVDAWLALASDADRRARLGAAARRRAEQFGWERAAETFEEVAREAYERVDGQRRRARSRR